MPRNKRTKSKSQPPTSPLANPTAVRIMAALAGGSRQLAEIAQVSYNKINTLCRGKYGNADFLYDVYRSLDSHPDFRRTLESAWSILDALREMGKIEAVPALEMTEVEARMFDNIHQPDEEEDQPLDFPGLPEEEKEETQPDQGRSESQDSLPDQAHQEERKETKPDQGHPEQPTTPTDQAHLPLAASHPNPAVRAFFRKSVDKARTPSYGSSIIDDMFTATDKENDDETPITEQTATTGDVMSVITRNPGGVTTAITDPFESKLRKMPDEYDSDNKRF